MLTDERIEEIEKLRAGLLSTNAWHRAVRQAFDDLLAEREELVAEIKMWWRRCEPQPAPREARIIDSVTTYGAYEKPI